MQHIFLCEFYKLPSAFQLGGYLSYISFKRARLFLVVTWTVWGRLHSLGAQARY